MEARQKGAKSFDFKSLMLLPHDFSDAAIKHPVTRALMEKMTFRHGGEEYDRRYPDGIPTSIQITGTDGKEHDSGLVMYPSGHARNTTADLNDILAHKFRMLGGLATGGDEPAAQELVRRYSNVGKKSAAGVAGMHDFELVVRDRFE
jgi:2-methylcitrate dehydratase